MIEIEGLYCGYNGRPVLRDVYLRFSGGKVWGILGRNGSGKSTLLRCINGIIRPMRGRILFQGREISKMARKDLALRMAVVPQGTDAFLPFRAIDVTLMGIAPRLPTFAAPSARHREAAAAVMNELGIGHLASRPFPELSGGERQLTLLARAIFQDTPVLLLDEPTAHLDLNNQVRVMRTVCRLAREKGLTVILTVHDPNLALLYCDSCALISDGHVVAMGPSEEVLCDRVLSRVYDLPIQVDFTSSGVRVAVPVESSGIEPHRPESAEVQVPSAFE
ncbi:MAG: ABC transporter ATP-binding protein [Clostridia bacterium]|nr:ABC transporter ATP-binding protein [Clostridia bacterium]MDH7572827.1 ABC transporter ATP-binding protein [Clostridia bacterium]